MSDKPTIPGPQYTWLEGLGVALAMGQRALAEVRSLARMPGPEGRRGLAGERGEKGERGEPGKQGAVGPAGADGQAGERGAKGEPGRNAADLRLLQEQIEQLIEQRVERMMATMTVTTPDGGRTLLFSFGDTVVREVTTALVLDAGVWKDGETYEAGDGVTLGGSFFIAQADSTTATPGKSDDWRLAVKRGTDGRDFRPDEKLAAEPIRFK